jgi:hypothetical protein
MTILFFCAISSVAQRNIKLTGQGVILFKHYNKAQTKIKKEYYHDDQGKLHPKVLRYTRKGVLKHCYYYDHDR